MTKTTRRDSPSTKHQNKKNLTIYLLIVVLAAIPFGFGKYFEFNTPDAFDGGAYVYSAKHILEGARIGIDEKPSAQSGTLLVNMLGVSLFGFSDTGPELIQMILQLAALVLMFITMQKLFGRLPAAISVIIASIYLSAPLVAKYGNVKDQYMIAFMIMGISCLILYQLSSKWWQAILAGAFLVWAPLFKETGFSAIGATGIFIISQPFFKHKSWKQTITDIALLLTGAVLGLAPVYIWLAIAKAPISYWPYYLLCKPFISDSLTSAGAGYISKSHQLMNLSALAPRIFRFYLLLILPIALATGSVIIRISRIIRAKLPTTKEKTKPLTSDRFVLLLTAWWLLDMIFIWISPRSYEQYYLPLNASAAMLAGYLITVYQNAYSMSLYKTKWVLTGIISFICMIILSWPIFFGVQKSPHTGADYGEKQRGYTQKFNEVSIRRKQNWIGHWEIVGQYIRTNSQPTDKIYVWGWFPGIYVQAQRLSPAPKAFEGTMHTLSPDALSERIDEILNAFENHPPKFIVDSRKNHFPWDRPPLQLWPQTKKGFLPNNKQVIDVYNAMYYKMLQDQIEPDEAERFKVMQPFREYVMNNYKIVKIPAGQHVLFERK